MKKILAAAIMMLLSACGGGGDDGSSVSDGRIDLYLEVCAENGVDCRLVIIGDMVDDKHNADEV